MIAYFDTSALMKLLLTEHGSATTRKTFDRARHVFASAVVYPEARAAAAAAVTDGRAVRHVALRRLGEALARMSLVAPHRELLWHAGDLAERHGLRGYDAVHLASALDVDEDVVVVAADMRLLNAARAESLRVLLPA